MNIKYEQIAALSAKCLALSALTFTSTLSYADENGSGFWLTGQYASGAALPPSPGFGITTMFYSYKGTQNSTVPAGSASLNSNVSATTTALLLQPSYTFDTKILGAVPSVGIGFGPGNAFTAVTYAAGPLQVYSGNQTTPGMSDLYPIVNLYWSDRNKNHFMAYVTGNIPTGTYNSNNLANLGLGHAAVDAGGAYTYTNRKTQWEGSAVLGFTNNFKNTATNYKSGIDSHLDFAVSKGITRQLSAGIAGYVYYQLTADGGSGDTVGPYKGRVLGLGPEVGYLFTLGGNDTPMTYLNVRAYKESWVENRTGGYTMFAVLTLRWGENNIHKFTPNNLTTR
jgi:hypothetical protein